MPATFGDVYRRLCERYPDPRERGRQFEPLVAQVLRTDKQYTDRFAEVWRWPEWPGRRSGDIGIDIVARRHDGGLTAIQCKCYDPASTLYEQDLATFLAYTNADFDERVIVSTTSNWMPLDPSGGDTIRPVALPTPVEVEEGPDGLPVAVRLEREWQRVERIEDRWTFDLWWLPAPISRVYYRVSGEDGRQVTLCRDQHEKRWSRQAC